MRSSLIVALGLMLAPSVRAAEEPGPRYLPPVDYARLSLEAKKVDLEGCEASRALAVVSYAAMTQRANNAEEKLAILIEMLCGLSILCAIVFRKEIFDR